VLSRVLARLSDDWQARYAHPLLVVETFVDPELFQGTVYRASGWTELGQTEGYVRHARDYYENHGKPKRLFVRELVPNARRSLQAEQLKPALAAVEAKVPVRSTLKAAALASLSALFQTVPDYRRRLGRYPLFALLSIAATAYLAGAPRGQKALAGFARRLSSAQRRALGVASTRGGSVPRPASPPSAGCSNTFRRNTSSRSCSPTKIRCAARPQPRRSWCSLARSPNPAAAKTWSPP